MMLRNDIKEVLITIVKKIQKEIDEHNRVQPYHTFLRICFAIAQLYIVNTFHNSYQMRETVSQDLSITLNLSQPVFSLLYEKFIFIA